jgi:copper oxidase (laccase) domain-containing protein
MPKKSYAKRDTTPDRVLENSYFVEERNIEILVSTCQDGNMDPRLSDDALSNFRKFLEKHGISPTESFSPAIGLNYGIITIDESNEEKFSGRFIENGNAPDGYHCDSVIVHDTTIPVAFRVGDCPVVLIVGQSPGEKTTMALVHAGRAELQAGILTKTVDRMVAKHQIHPRSGTAYVFPHICKHCYALQHVDPATKEKAQDFLKFVDEHYHLDLMEWLKRQLNEAGIQRISTAFFRCTAGISPVCVSRLLHDMAKAKSKSLFFSHYRSFHQDSSEGRFIIVARIVDRDYESEDLFQED